MSYYEFNFYVRFIFLVLFILSRMLFIIVIYDYYVLIDRKKKKKTDQYILRFYISLAIQCILYIEYFLYNTDDLFSEITFWLFKFYLFFDINAYYSLILLLVFLYSLWNLYKEWK